jgi:hypothetical protein
MSGLPSPGEYWLAGRGEGAENVPGGIKTQYASVVQLTAQGDPILQFPRESLPSKKTYRRLSSYKPAIGDRVMLIDETIIGGWKAPGA